jgi:hypothetical protein
MAPMIRYIGRVSPFHPLHILIHVCIQSRYKRPAPKSAADVSKMTRVPVRGRREASSGFTSTYSLVKEHTPPEGGDQGS